MSHLKATYLGNRRADQLMRAIDAFRFAKETIARDVFALDFRPFEASNLASVWPYGIRHGDIHSCEVDDSSGVAFLLSYIPDTTIRATGKPAFARPSKSSTLHAFLRGESDFLSRDMELNGYELADEYKDAWQAYRRYGCAKHDANCRAVAQLLQMISTYENPSPQFVVGLAVFYFNGTDWQPSGEVDFMGEVDDSYLDENAVWFDMGLRGRIAHARIEAEQCRTLRRLGHVA